MTKTRLIAAIAVANALVLASCSARGASAQAPEDTAREAFVTSPSVPDSIFDPVERADYAVMHYWDAFDFAADKLTEQTFAPYAEYVAAASAEGVADGARVLLLRLEKYPDTYRQMARMAQKFFFRKDSPYYSERAFTAWLDVLSDSSVLSAAEHERYEYLRQVAMKNSVGSKAENIRFRTPQGSESSLYAVPSAPYTLLVLYDPDCDTCHEVLARVRSRKDIMQLVDRGTVRVVLIDVADDEALFRKDAATMPANWVKGHDLSRVEDNDLYIFEATPSLYLLDSQKRVLLKEPTVDQLIDYARSH